MFYSPGDFDWAGDLVPERVLEAKVTVSEAAGQWGPGHHHEETLRIAGSLARHGVPVDDCWSLIRRLGESSGADLDDLRRAVEHCYQREQAGNGTGLVGSPWTYHEILGQEISPPDWIVEPFVSPGDVCVVTADGGVGKTYFLLAMSLFASRGETFLGHFPTRRSRWLIGDFDMHADAHLVRWRIQRLAAGYGLSHEALKGSGLVIARQQLPGGINLTKKTNIDTITGLLEKHEIDVAVLEVLGSIHGADNENDNAQMDQAMNTLREMASKTGAAIIVTHHTRKTPSGITGDVEQMGRGASAIKNRVDCMIGMRKKRSYDTDETPAGVVVTHIKGRYMQPAQEFIFEIQDDPQLEGTRIMYSTENIRSPGKVRECREWIRDTLWPDAVGEGCNFLWQRDIIEEARSQGKGSDRVVRDALNWLKKQGLATSRLELRADTGKKQQTWMLL